MNIITRIRKSYITKGVAMMLALNMLFEFIWPTAAMALTTGPSQPEYQSFEPVETTDMVNLFTGDFTYNIPLMYVPGPNGGYPINLAYHGGISMDQEASWVGLGWNINAGAINRAVRGVPDDFNGDKVRVKNHIKANWTVGLGVSACIEAFGADGCQGKEESGSNLALQAGLNFRFNSYRGFGYGFDIGVALASDNEQNNTYRVGLSMDNDDGVGANGGFSWSKETENKKGQEFSVTNSWGIGFNSKRGLDLNSSRSVAPFKYAIDGVGEVSRDSYEGSKSWDNRRRTMYESMDMPFESPLHRDPGLSKTAGSSSWSFSSSIHPSPSLMPMNNYRLSVNLGAGAFEIYGVYTKPSFSGYVDIQSLLDNGNSVSHKSYGYENMYEGMEFGDFSRSNDGSVMKTSPNLATPQLTHDFYNIQGQGIGGSFRPYRNEPGRIYDPKTTSAISGGYYNGDLAVDHAGWGGGVTVGASVVKAWNNSSDNIDFSQTHDLWQLQESDHRKKERVIYKSHGEKSTLSSNELNYIGGEDPVCAEISGTGSVGNYDAALPGTILDERNVQERVSRNNLIHKLKNEEINSFHETTGDLTWPYAFGDDFMHEYEIFYYDWQTMDQSTDPNVYLNRRVRGAGNHDIESHNAGYKVLDQNGGYYVYGLPTYNNKMVEKTFTLYANDPSDLVSSGTPIHSDNKSIVPLPLDVSGTKIEYKKPNTYEFYSERETPPYANSYLLTSILGADYVDVQNDGITDDDKGYWVKMDYVKYADNYKWRAPYYGCMYSPEALTTLEDDKGSYQYGEKEMWFLSRIETATHIVIFTLSERNDNLEVKEELNQKTTSVNTDLQGTKSGLKIDKISLYEKKAYKNDPVNAVPIQEVHFEYDYSLCSHPSDPTKDVTNNDGGLQTNDSAIENQGGKLTLKKIWFTYENNSRGALNPYIFDYGSFNPYYGTDNYDRWGNYKPLFDNSALIESREINQQLPYVDQYYQGFSEWTQISGGTLQLENETNKAAFQQEKDNYTSAWSLKKITLPSGGEINVTYESDDYAYVQSERATQMTYITRVNDNTGDNHLYKKSSVGGGSENNFDTDPTERRIYFKLENPIPTAGYTNAQYAQMIFDDYVKDLIKDEAGKRNLYCRVKTTLRGEAAQGAVQDYVAGYVPLEDQLTDGSIYHYGIDPGNTAVIDGTSCYTHGFVTVECGKDKSGNCYKKYHPIALMAWQHIRSNAPEVLSDMGAFNNNDIGTDKKKAKKVKSLVGWIPELKQMFSGYRQHCYKKEMAQEIDLKMSMIRLTTPDRKKYGGGVRVKQIAMSDNWDDFEAIENEESYGLVYDYTTSEIINGEEVKYSSGVAQYEPMIGADEIALRYPKHYPGKIPFKTNNNLFFEHPINESYMPGPVVGYSKVTVTSLNTKDQITKAEDQSQSPDYGRGVTGVTEYEFYTAKDFPVIVEETEIKKKNFNVPIFIPFIATYTRNKLAASQGYKIELNDMHGKLKSMASYGLGDDYKVKTDPLTKVTYLYNSSPVVYHGKIVRRLNNLVPTLTIDPTNHEYNDVPEDKLVGVEYEFFTDQRHNKTWSLTLGFNGNIDAVFIGTKIPIPSFWGTVNSSKNDLRTFVTNKVIHKSGILTEVETKNEHYISKSSNMLFDPVTGRPVLTVSSNEFDQSVYSLTHPAHFEYEGMGHAYKNINMEFAATLTTVSASQKLFAGPVPLPVIDELVPGDELIARYESSPGVYRNFKATFITKDYNDPEGDNAVFYIENFQRETQLTTIDAYFKVYRSGRRNHYMAGAGNIVALDNPVTQHVLNSNVAYTSGIGSGIQVDEMELDNVINASATTFRDNWEQESGDNENPYMTGEQGIWRSHKQYAYIGARTQNKVVGVKTYQDGVMNDVTLFNWQLMDFENHRPNWHWASEVTRYNEFGYEIENIDRLGVYSAALYGYNKAFAIGLGANAEYEELGCEDFERFTVATPNDDIPGEMDKEGNLNFYESHSTANNSVAIHDQYRILGGKVETPPTASYVIIDKPYDANYWTGADVDASLIADFTMGSLDYRLIRPEVTASSYASGAKTKLEFLVRPKNTTAGTYLQLGAELAGKVTVYRSKSVSAADNGTYVTFVDTYAHTGKQCAKIDANNAVTFRHGRMQLKADKTYTMSVWIRRDNASVPFYDVTNMIKVEDYENANNDLQSAIRTGRIVEGWQKVEIDFVPTVNGNTIQTVFDPGSDILYIDDIRIAPKTGGIVTYVYDPENFRLKATLNANNYATFYYYDEQGNLYLTKQETEEGIFTVSESHGYNKPNPVN